MTKTNSDAPSYTNRVKTIIITKMLYKITVSFSNKTIYLDPKDGKSAMSQTLDGVLQILKEH